MRSLVAITVVFVAAACTQAGEGAMSGSARITAADSSAIVALDARLKAAALAANWDAWGAEYTSDPVRYAPNMPTLVGKAAADAFNHASPKFSTFDVAVTSVTGRGDLAVTTGTFKASAPAGKDASGKAVPATNDEGKFMQLLLKQADGSWKVARDIWNSDLPVPVATGTAKK
jgi:ketosteroid isomerase-like protein